MKANRSGKFTFSALVLLLPLLGSCTPQASTPPSSTNNVPGSSNTVASAPADTAATAEIPSAPDPAPPAPPPDLSPVSVAPDNTTAGSSLPPNIYPTSPLAQVIRLAQSGVDESIILAFIANSGGTFTLDSDKIIYLKDIGLSKEIVTAMMQRDQQLQQQTAAASQPAPAPEPPPQTTPETAPPAPPAEPEAPPAEITINYFYDTLAPYGTWVNVDGYGRCWRPSVVVYNRGWQPYCDHGHWIYTDCGWYWSSDYSWGWAPFHYGRWFQHPYWGWCWTPDTFWGPSWVTWRYMDGYCGWAPLPPFAVFRPGVGFFYRGAAVSIGFNWGLSVGCFTFVPTQFFCDPHPRRHCVAPAQVTQIFNRTTVINNFNVREHNPVNRGIEPERITDVTRTPIRPVAIRTTRTPPGQSPQGDQLSHDGGTLIVSRPTRIKSPAQNRPSPPVDNRPAAPTRPVREPQVPVVSTRNPEESGAILVPAQHPAPPVNYNPAPRPNYDNRTYPPRQRQHIQSAGPSQESTGDAWPPALTPPSPATSSGAVEAGRHNAPTAAPAPQPPQRSQPSAPPPAPAPSRSPERGQNQSRSDDNSGNASGGGSVGGHGPGPRH